ncbi:DUF5753 domain-containing protein [Lentzea sp. NPDC059081]|uniref:DUF5753 domain-containing protein n=1 Tax=Lentzea sp. NPDC059081 TaxID=3346719 RepID=UPI0036760A6E
MNIRLSTVHGREFGAGVEAAIVRSDLRQADIARILNWHDSKVSNLVNGKGGATQQEIAQLLGVCRTKPAIVTHLLALFAMREQSGWWQQHGICQPVELRTTTTNLRSAATLVSWNPHVVPDLLQTTDYLRAVLQASATLPADELEQRVEARRKLQGAMLRVKTRTFFIHELALRLPVGGAAVHTEQLRHLATEINPPNMTIRIVPAAQGAHAGMAGAFTRLTGVRQAPVVLVQTENSSLFAEAKDAVTGYEMVITALEKTSLTCEESKKLIAGLCREARL